MLQQIKEIFEFVSFIQLARNRTLIRLIFLYLNHVAFLSFYGSADKHQITLHAVR